MKVFVLTVNHSDGSTVLGVYSTITLAQQALENEENQAPCLRTEFFIIDEYTIDEGMKKDL